MKSYQTDQFERVLRLNLLGFMKPPKHMNLVTDEAVTEAAKFLKRNRKDFAAAQSKYQVSPDVIASLLWIETRHGDNLGDFHIVSVFLNLLQADKANSRKTLTRMALWQNNEGKEFSQKELTKIIRERTAKKANWARDEIKALASIFNKKQLDLTTLKGSYAGAFGMTQFLPSSYRDFARAAQGNTAPNLMEPDEAIMSVAHYLSRHGWKAKKTSSDQRSIKALMSYNNSRDYAESILEISRRVQN
jgi:membrane-bound lytic murein transglycosylase B